MLSMNGIIGTIQNSDKWETADLIEKLMKEN